MQGHKKQDQSTPGKKTWKNKCGQKVSEFSCSWRKMKITAQDRSERNVIYNMQMFNVYSKADEWPG